MRIISFGKKYIVKSLRQRRDELLSDFLPHFNQKVVVIQNLVLKEILELVADVMFHDRDIISASLVRTSLVIISASLVRIQGCAKTFELQKKCRFSHRKYTGERFRGVENILTC